MDRFDMEAIQKAGKEAPLWKSLAVAIVRPAGASCLIIAVNARYILISFLLLYIYS